MTRLKKPGQHSTKRGAVSEELKPRVRFEIPDYWADEIRIILSAWHEKFNEVPTDRLAGQIIMARNRWESQSLWVTPALWVDLIEKSPDLEKIKDPDRRMGRLIQMISLHL